MTRVAHQNGRHVFDGQRVRRQTGGEGGLRHAFELRGIGPLHQHDSAVADDAPQSHRAIGAGARQNDADRLLLLILSERLKEMVDRHPVPARALQSGQVQYPGANCDLLAGRNRVHVA